VFKCGLKLSDPCSFPATKPIKIKFCKGGGDLSVCKDKIKEYEFFDIGAEASKEASDGKFTYGWTKSGEHNVTVSKFDQSNEQTVYEGSAGLMDIEHPGEWFIKVSPGDYKVSLELK